MAQLHRSVAALRISGDSLIPAEISLLIGTQPSHSKAKGEVSRGKKTGREYVARSGIWILDAADHKPENVDGQIAEILGKLTADLAVWRSISEKYEVDLFCGWFMEGRDEGLAISASNLAALGNRGIELAVCLYGPMEEDELVELMSRPNDLSDGKTVPPR